MRPIAPRKTNADRLRESRQQAEAAVESAWARVESLDARIAEAQYAVNELKRERTKATAHAEQAEAVADEWQRRQFA